MAAKIGDTVQWPDGRTVRLSVLKVYRCRCGLGYTSTRRAPRCSDCGRTTQLVRKDTAWLVVP